MAIQRKDDGEDLDDSAQLGVDSGGQHSGAGGAGGVDADGGDRVRDTEAFIDEIPRAYKDIDQVMADASELVDIRHTLRQVVNVKGD